MPCYLTYTTPKTHEIIRNNLDKAPAISGEIKGIGPRYCPSIETKVVRFADKERHQLFLEPEAFDTKEMYLQGFSTSMPADIQVDMVHSVIGLEKAEIMRDAYAIEYDCIEPTQLKATLELKTIPGLFFAGQINGTSALNFILPATAPVISAGVIIANIIWKAQNTISGISKPLVLSEILTLFNPKKSRPPTKPPASAPNENE